MTPLAIPVLVMAGVTLYVGVYYFLMWLRIREETSYFYFSGLCAAVAAYDALSALLYNSRTFESSIWFQRGQFSAIACIALWTMLFASRFLRRKLSAWLWLLFGFYATFIFTSYINSPLFLHLSRRAPKTFAIGATTIRYLEAQPGPLLVAFFLLIFGGILTAFIFFSSTYRAPREQKSALIQASLVIFFLAIVNDMLVGAGIMRFVYLLEYSYLAVILAMDFVLQRNYLALVNKEKMYARELEGYLEKVKSLKGLVPICSYCKKIQDDQRGWRPIEEFVSEHSSANFSHGICPECARRMYPDLFEKEEPK